MKVIVNNDLIVDWQCECCGEMEYMVVVSSLVVWDDNGKPTCMDNLKCENCNTLAESGKWDVTKIDESPDFKEF